jgi:hypothetical protein
MDHMLTFILCENIDNFHEGKGGEGCYHLYAVIEPSGYLVDEPGRAEAEEILQRISGNVRCVVSPCSSCRHKGVLGPKKEFYIQREAEP